MRWLFPSKTPSPGERQAAEAYRKVEARVRAARESGAAMLDLSSTGAYNLARLPPSIAQLPALQSLSLAGAGIRSIAVLSDLDGLEQLDLGACRNLSDISPLMGTRRLRALDLDRTGVTDIAPLARLTRLTKLCLDGCRITDLAPLSGLTALEHLNIANVGATDISALAGLTSLRSLSLWNVEIDDLAPLAALTKLERLDLWNTRVSDLGPLSGLARLTRLDLSHTDVTDLAPLSALPDLRHLILWNTQVQEHAFGQGAYDGRWSDDRIWKPITDGDLDGVKACVARGAMIGARDWEGPFHGVVKAGHLDICRFLVSLDPGLVDEIASYDGVYPCDTPLSLAIKHGHRHIVDFLIEAAADLGAGPGEWDEGNIGGLHLASAASVGDVETLRRILSAGIPHDAPDETGRTALQWAVAANQRAAACLLFNLWRAARGLPPCAEADITDAMLSEAATSSGAG